MPARVTTSPSSTVWMEDGQWHAHITIYLDNECAHQVHLSRVFEFERDAMQWRAILIGSLVDFSVEVRYE